MSRKRPEISSRICRFIADVALRGLVVGVSPFFSVDARAATLFGAVNFSSTTAEHFANSLGIAMDHRAMEAATGIAAYGAGFDLGLGVSAMKGNDDFSAAMSDLGAGSAFSLPVIPAIALNVHKSTGSRVDFGATWISLPSSSNMPFALSMLGFDLKYVIWQPEESPTWALRISYGQSSFGLPLASQSMSIPGYGTVSGSVDLSVMTYSWTPQLLVSRRLDWAEGYIGVGYHIPTAIVKVDASFSPPMDSQNLSVSERGTGGAFEAFTGLSLRMPLIGIHLTMEGWYSAVGAPGLAVKLGTSL